MKKIFLFLLGLMMLASVNGQQLRVSNTYLFNPSLMNPASMGTHQLNNVFVAHQQRRTAVAGWRSTTQFLNFCSQPLGKSERFGWGLNLNTDNEWSEFRVGANFSVAAHVIRSETQRLSLGVNFGIIGWGSNYEKVRIYDQDDPLLSSRGNFVEIDAGGGLEYALRLKRLRADFGLWSSQMPGNWLSDSVRGMVVYPHIFGGAGILFSPIHNLFVGPRVFYRNIFMSDALTISKSQMDIGVKAELDRQNMWFGGAYRVNRGALTAAFGMRLIQTDTVGNPGMYGYFVDMNASFALPMGLTNVFGPTFELGLNIQLGRNDHGRYRIDTLRRSNGPFWLNEGNINDHLEQKMKKDGPDGLKATTMVSKRSVVVTYQFDDNSYQYVGTSPVSADTLIEELGSEWQGVDELVERVVGEVIVQALHPDSSGFLNPEVLEALEGLVYIELSANLLVDEQQAGELAKGKLYEGELGSNSINHDSLYLKVVYNDADTIVGVGKDRQITNLELACLKLHAIRKKLEYELNEQYGDVWAVYWEGEDQTLAKTQGRRVVYIKKPRITPRNPNLGSFQVNTIKLRFSRGKSGEDSDATSDEAVVDVNTKHTKRRHRREQKQIRERVY